MAIYLSTGFDLWNVSTGAVDAEYLPCGWIPQTGTPTQDTTVFRNGRGSLACDSNEFATIVGLANPILSASVTSTRYFRAAIRFETGFANANGALFNCGPCYFKFDANSDLRMDYNTSGGNQSFGNALDWVANTWYVLEWAWFHSTTAGIDWVEWRVDGITMGRATALSLTWSAFGDLIIGVDTHASGAKVWFDDVMCRDDDWCHNGANIDVVPVTDSQVGSWTGGAGGTSNLYDAVNNMPPTGTASETDATQIESNDNSGNNTTDEYRPSFGTYLSMGFKPADKILRIYGFLTHGEDINTQSKTGSWGWYSNPSNNGTYTTFTFGDDVGAVGSWPSNWAAALNSVGVPDGDYAAIDLNADFIAALRKTDTGTRVGSVCSVVARIGSSRPWNLLLPQPSKTQRLFRSRR